MDMLSQLRERGIGDEVLAAFKRIDRSRFIASDDPDADKPQPIGHGQTISQPYIVAYMLQELDIHPSDKILEVGSGSGYVVALLTLLARQVIGTEIITDLHKHSQQTLRELREEGIIPGTYTLLEAEELGAPGHAPFDKILVSAATPELPPELINQLADGGVMILPLGTDDQWLVRIEKHGETLTHEQLLPVRFVPLL